jgi:hypothetical protein
MSKHTIYKTEEGKKRIQDHYEMYLKAIDFEFHIPLQHWF